MQQTLAPVVSFSRSSTPRSSYLDPTRQTYLKPKASYRTACGARRPSATQDIELCEKGESSLIPLNRREKYFVSSSRETTFCPSRLWSLLIVILPSLSTPFDPVFYSDASSVPSHLVFYRLNFIYSRSHVFGYNTNSLRRPQKIRTSCQDSNSRNPYGLNARQGCPV